MITKTLTHQDPGDCAQEFTFRITRADGETEVPVWGNEWVLLNEDGTESNTKGTLGRMEPLPVPAPDRP